MPGKMRFTPATKKQGRGRLAIEGPSGSGKTWTLLTFARVLGERLALVDTEFRSASKYADIFNFDVCELEEYNPTTLIEALAVAGAESYPVFGIDSFSHFWQGPEGMLDQVSKITEKSRSKNAFTTGWRDMSPVEQQMFRAILSYPGHVILTLRQKTEWVVVDGEPRRIGTEAIQRKGIEYEFDVVAEMDLKHNMNVTKSRCPVLSDQLYRKPDGRVAKIYLDWLSEGKPDETPSLTELASAMESAASRDTLLIAWERVKTAGYVNELTDLYRTRWHQLAPQQPASAPSAVRMPTDDQRTRLHTMLGHAGITDRDDKLAYINELMPADREHGPVTSTKDLTLAEYNLVCDMLQQAISEPHEQEPVS